MKTITLETASGDLVRCAVAASIWHRTRGLLGRPKPNPSSGLLIERCSSIHTVGMAYPIDVVFLDPALRVMRVVPKIGVCRGAWCRRAKHALELAAGEAARCGIVAGTSLRAVAG